MGMGFLGAMLAGGVQQSFNSIAEQLREEARMARKQSLLRQQQIARHYEREGDRLYAEEQAEKKRENAMQDAKDLASWKNETFSESFEDVTDESGNIIGQRNTKTNKYSPFSSKSDFSKQKLILGSLENEIKGLTQQLENEMDPERRRKISENLTSATNELQGLRSQLSGNSRKSPMLGDFLQTIPKEQGQAFYEDSVKRGRSDQELKQIADYFGINQDAPEKTSATEKASEQKGFLSNILPDSASSKSSKRGDRGRIQDKANQADFNRVLSEAQNALGLEPRQSRSNATSNRANIARIKQEKAQELAKYLDTNAFYQLSQQEQQEIYKLIQQLQNY